MKQEPEVLSEKVIAGTQCKIAGENSIRVVQEDRSNLEKDKSVTYQENLREKLYEDIILLQKVNQEPEVLLEKDVERLESVNEKWI
jgi:hypothetical protein